MVMAGVDCCAEVQTVASSDKGQETDSAHHAPTLQ